MLDAACKEHDIAKLQLGMGLRKKNIKELKKRVVLRKILL